MSSSDTRHARNALHAAHAWLERIDASAASVAVVRIGPPAAVGVWTPGRDAVGVLREVDDAGAELCEAVAPWLQDAMTRLSAGVVAAASSAVLQVLLRPSAGELVLRAVHGGRSVVLCETQLIDVTH